MTFLYSIFSAMRESYRLQTYPAEGRDYTRYCPDHDCGDVRYFIDDCYYLEHAGAAHFGARNRRNSCSHLCRISECLLELAFILGAEPRTEYSKTA